MSEVFASASPPPEPGLAPPVAAVVLVPDGSVAVLGSLLPQAASSGMPAPAAARPPRARREILSVVMTAGSSQCRAGRVERSLKMTLPALVSRTLRVACEFGETPLTNESAASRVQAD